MKAIAYAYMNFSPNNNGGSPNFPRTKGDGSISGFTRDGTETKFLSPKNGDKEQYIESIIDSLTASGNRLRDPSNKDDPTQGADHWNSPGVSGQDKKFPPSGNAAKAWGMHSIIVPGIPERTFTFYKK